MSRLAKKMKFLQVFLNLFIFRLSICHNILRWSDIRIAKFVLRHTDKVRAQTPYREFTIFDEAACIDRCVEDGSAPCKSVNFFRNETDVNQSICQLLSADITDTNEYTNKPGWRHFDTGKTRLTRLMHSDGYCFVPNAASCVFSSSVLSLRPMSECDVIEAWFDFDRNTGIISHVCSGKALCPGSRTFGNDITLINFGDCEFYKLDSYEREKFRIHMNVFLEFYVGCACQYPLTGSVAGNTLRLTHFGNCDNPACQMRYDFENGPVKVTIVSISGVPYNGLVTRIRAKINAGEIWAVRYIDGLMYRTRAHDTFGTKMQTIFQAPSTGTYTFYIHVDKYAKVMMSTDETKANLLFRLGGGPIFNWDAAVANEYKTDLEKDKKYYMEIYTFDDTGDDWFYLYFKAPGNGGWEVMGYEYLEPYTG
ncbi:uncharacterized protein [Clytia hemisphaerica]